MARKKRSFQSINKTNKNKTRVSLTALQKKEICQFKSRNPYCSHNWIAENICSQKQYDWWHTLWKR